jgi:hypothetical protein
MNVPDVFELPSGPTETSQFPWISAWAIAAIVLGALMILVAAHEDTASPGPQITVLR